MKKLVYHSSIKEMNPDYKVDSELMKEMKNYISNAPTSIHAQGLSIIDVTDQNIKNTIYGYVKNYGQEHIRDASHLFIFVADFNKANILFNKSNREVKITDYLESLTVSAIDIGVALGYARVFAAENGLQTCPIGILRFGGLPEVIIDLLKLPLKTMPLVGLVIGKTKNPELKQKPRLDINSLFHDNTYNQENVVAAVEQAIAEPIRWSGKIKEIYAGNYAEKFAKTMIKQGFKFKDVQEK